MGGGQRYRAGCGRYRRPYRGRPVTLRYAPQTARVPATLPPELSGLLAAAGSAPGEAAWAAFLQAHSRLLLSVCRSVGRDYDATMDAYAFVLDQLRKDDYRRLRAYAADGRSKFTTWLVVVARRLCLDHHRHEYGRARDGGTDAVKKRGVRRRLIDLIAADVDPGTIADPASVDPETAVMAGEQAARVSAAVAGLEPRDRLLLTLRFEDDLSAREIGELLGFPTPFHVYRRLTAVLATLRWRLDHDPQERSR